MPACCCIIHFKNMKRKKNLDIIYHRFPFKNTNIINYWIAATGRDNWIPYSDARISSVHFTHNDYYNINSNPQKRYLKPDAIPTQNVCASILQLLQQNTANANDQDASISKDDQNNDIFKEEATHRTTDLLTLRTASVESYIRNLKIKQNITITRIVLY
ncbi:hypothetical protein DMN91_003393 [Ooceraea biroi]|uniref:THAP-type domain-containing protein n=1 Tax=Ooceraea biroi TaxID=2015173 RepID=A0A3L8DXU2_OOCBI|nr:THAP domain-containing protein 4 [Ooceraea biroi]RLU25300.1 hypothetical protein DMN91_003393 [Ooceraea biroi]